MSNPKPIKISLTLDEALRRAMQVPPPDDEPKPKKAPKVVSKRPAKKQDAADVDRAAGEGMGQPQGRPAKKRKK